MMVCMHDDEIQALTELLAQSFRILVFTGAGI